MTIPLSVDRFAGKDKDKAIAVLLTDDGQAIEFPRALLPKGTKPGDVLRFSIDKDEATTQQVSKETKSIQDKFQKGDTGGDLKL